MALPLAARWEAQKRSGGNSAKTPPVRGGLSQQRMLKTQLKLRDGTPALWKRVLQVSDGLEQRIGVRAWGRLLLATKPRSQSIQVAPQLSAQLIEGLQHKGQAKLFGGGFNRKAGQQLD